MPIPVTCPCGYRTQVKDHLAGYKTRCNRCQQIFRVPGTKIPEVMPVSITEPELPPEPAHKPPSAPTRPKALPPPPSPPQPRISSFPVLEFPSELPGLEIGDEELLELEPFLELEPVEDEPLEFEPEPPPLELEAVEEEPLELEPVSEEIRLRD